MDSNTKLAFKTFVAKKVPKIDPNGWINVGIYFAVGSLTGLSRGGLADSLAGGSTRCGLNEINLPPMQPGSSIRPGKVNPVIPELVNQVCYQIIAYDAVVSMAAEASELELCMAEPIIAYDLLHGMLILKNACIALTSRCITGIQVNRDVCRRFVENSIGLVTALNPVLGYERSAAIAKEALKTGGSVYELVPKRCN